MMMRRRKRSTRRMGISKTDPHLAIGVMLIQKCSSTLEFCNLFIMKQAQLISSLCVCPNQTPALSGIE
jgi:hypothetical protein